MAKQWTGSAMQNHCLARMSSLTLAHHPLRSQSQILKICLPMIPPLTPTMQKKRLKKPSEKHVRNERLVNGRSVSVKLKSVKLKSVKLKSVLRSEEHTYELKSRGDQG